MKPLQRPLVLAFLLLLTATLFAHETLGIWPTLGLPDPVHILTIGSVVAAVGIVLALITQKTAGPNQKKVVFLVIALPVVLVTLYLSATTIYLNLVSETGGPVHWHADYEVWACGQQFILVPPMGLENRVGTSTVHEHNDNRIHIEGVLLHKSDARLGEFFEAVGGAFTPFVLALPTDEGVKTWRNGDLCNGMPARWYLFVNGQPNPEMDDYVPSPYPTVPPGDRIKFVFTEKPLAAVNGELGEEP